MHIIDQKMLGILIVILLAVLVVIKRVSTGSILEKPKPDILLWLVNIFNLFFLLAANPAVAVLLITGGIEKADPSILPITGGIMTLVETAGFIIYMTGFILMGWALIGLGANYQLGGSDPRPADKLVICGPYKFMRHPMYTSALCIAFGLACLTGSLICLGAFIIYLLLILLLIPIEEKSLLSGYGEEYEAYRQRVKKLVPLVF